MQVGRDRIAAHEAELKDYAHERLGRLNWLKIHGHAKDKGAIVSFRIDGLHPHDISTIIDRSGVAVRAGHHCAQPLMERLGRHGHLPGLVRHVQYQGRGGCPCRGADQGARVLRVIASPCASMRRPNVGRPHSRRWSLSLRLTRPSPQAARVELSQMDDKHADGRCGRAGARGRDAAPGSSIPAEELEQLTADIVAALKTVYDPEIPADIYELGLIYKIDVDDERNVAVEMTLTSPGCPVAGEMPAWVENAVASVPGVGQVTREAHLRPALGQGPHVRRGQAGAGDVLGWAVAKGSPAPCRPRWHQPVDRGTQVKGAHVRRAVEASPPPRARVAANPCKSLLPLELAEQADKSRRQRRLDVIGGRGAKEVADRGQDDVVDVFGFVRQTEWAQPAGPHHCRSFSPRTRRRKAKSDR